MALTSRFCVLVAFLYTVFMNKKQKEILYRLLLEVYDLAIINTITSHFLSSNSIDFEKDMDNKREDLIILLNNIKNCND